MHKYLALALLPLAAAVHAQVGPAVGPAELPAAVPYNPVADETPPTPPAQANTTMPPVVNPFEVDYTVTLSGTVPNPRKTALERSFREGLTLTLRAMTPPATDGQVKALTEENDPALMLTTYQITDEVLTPQYSLSTHLSFNPSAIRRALAKWADPNTPYEETSPFPDDANTLTLRLSSPGAAALHRLKKWAEEVPQTTVMPTSITRDAALVAVTTPDTDTLLTRLRGKGLNVEPIGTVYWVSF